MASTPPQSSATSSDTLGKDGVVEIDLDLDSRKSQQTDDCHAQNSDTVNKQMKANQGDHEECRSEINKDTVEGEDSNVNEYRPSNEEDDAMVAGGYQEKACSDNNDAPAVDQATQNIEIIDIVDSDDSNFEKAELQNAVVATELDHSSPEKGTSARPMEVDDDDDEEKKEELEFDRPFAENRKKSPELSKLPTRENHEDVSIECVSNRGTMSSEDAKMPAKEDNKSDSEQNEDQETESNNEKKNPEETKALSSDDEQSDPDHSTVKDRKLSPEESKQPNDDDSAVPSQLKPTRPPRGGRRPISSVWDPNRHEFVPKQRVREGKDSQAGADNGQSSVFADENILSVPDSLSETPITNSGRKGKRKDDHFIGRNEDAKKARWSTGRKKLPEEHAATSPSFNDSEQEESSRKCLKSGKNIAPGSRGLSTSSKKSQDILSVGDRVCYEWESTKNWYSATIVSMTKKQHSRFYLYSLFFDDGDFLEDVSRNKVLTVEEYRKKYSGLPLPMPLEHAAILERLQNDSKFLESFPPGTYTLRELYRRSCFDCEFCRKSDCGACVSCRRNETVPEHEREVCIQKMCLRVPDGRKLQTADGLLPPGWSFLFKEDTPFWNAKKSYVPGLFVYHSSGNRIMRSPESVMACVPKFLDVNPNAVIDFNRHIGIMKDASPAKSGQKQLGPRCSTTGPCRSPMTLEDLLSNRCGDCPNCIKDDCKRCASCLSNRRQVCIQKMCCEAPVEAKTQPMPPSSGFPAEWTFVIDPTVDGYNYSKAQAEREGKTVFVDGLKIFSPAQDREYYSAETAKGHYRKALANANPTKFYQYIGALPGLSKETSRKKSTYNGGGACGSCSNCTKSSCGRCALCKSSTGGVSQSCLQKICLVAKPQTIAQPAIGFPDGYRFFFREEKNGCSPCPRIVTPGGREYTLYGALQSCRLDDREKVEREFREYVGLHSLNLVVSPCSVDANRANTDNFLVGRNFSLPWMTLNGQRKIVHGTVVKYNPPSEETSPSYQVVYSKESREHANMMTHGCGSMVPESQILSPEMAVGGCVRYEQERSHLQDERLVDIPELPFYVSWIIPDNCIAEFVKDKHGTYLPRLTLVVRGFKLTLFVKPSRIPNAGNGVFLSCMPMIECNGDDSDDELESFVLAPGELLDLGVYGPHRIADRKPEAAFFVKNFIHSRSCEEWAFDQKNSEEMVDITDEITGGVHDVAKKTVFPFVNECNEADRVNIKAEHDPEDSVHYLLGHSYEAQGSFEVPCNGKEIELYVHYDDGYEKVRVRKGYSFLPEEERGPILEELVDEDIADVKEMDEFDATEVRSALNYLFKLFSPQDESKFAEDVIQRALLCSAVLHHRTQCLFLDTNDLSQSLGKLFQQSTGLVDLLLRKAKDEGDKMKLLHSHGDVDGLMQRILQQHYSPDQLAKLGDMME